MNLFDILPDSLFKPLNSKDKRVYADCLDIIMDLCGSELSFGVDRNLIVEKLVDYFDFNNINLKDSDELGDNDYDILDSKDKANKVLRVLKITGWIEEEIGKNRLYKINFMDYSLTIYKSFTEIIKNEEMEYQSVISLIYNTIKNKEAYKKPYEYVLKNIKENTDKLINGLKKLNSNIKRQIEKITNDKSAKEIIENYFDYLNCGISKAYNRIKTSDNLNIYKIDIITFLKNFLSNDEIFDKTVGGYMEIEGEENREFAEDEVRNIVSDLIYSFNTVYDSIKSEIENKHQRYLNSSYERAKFLIASGENTADKIKFIINDIAMCLNRDSTLDNISDDLSGYANIFRIFPQFYIDNDSFSTLQIRKNISPPEEVNVIVIDDNTKQNIISERRLKNSNEFSQKNIDLFVSQTLAKRACVKASEFELKTKRDLIRLIFINLYGRNGKVKYKIEQAKTIVLINGFKFYDFEIRRE